MLRKPDYRDEGNQMLILATLAGELYPYDITPAEDIFKLLSTFLYLPMSNSRRIEIFETILSSDATKKFLINNGIAQRLLSSFMLNKTRVEASEMGSDFGEPMTMRDFDNLIAALVKINFLTNDVLLGDKMKEFQIVLKNWCNHQPDLKETLAAFASFDFKYPEQLRHCAHQMLMYALRDINNQWSQKLVNLQVHLRNDTYKGIQQFLDEIWKDFHERTLDMQHFDCDRRTSMQCVRYLSGLYMHNVIDSSVIIKCLNYYMKRRENITNSSFLAMFTIVEDKLKKEVSKLRFQTYSDYLVKHVIAGLDMANLPPACYIWISIRKEEYFEALKTQKKENDLEPNSQNSLEEVIEFYCHGARSLSQVLKDFEQRPSVPTEVLSKIANKISKLAMSEKGFGKKLVVLLKKLGRWVNYKELHGILLAVLGSHEFSEKGIISPDLHLKNTCYVEFLTDLFMEGVIEQHLIVKCLLSFESDGGDYTDPFFVSMYRTTIKKLQLGSYGRALREYNLDMVALEREGLMPMWTYRK